MSATTVLQEPRACPKCGRPRRVRWFSEHDLIVVWCTACEAIPLRGLGHFVRSGRHYRYPACCIAQFCLDLVRGQLPATRRGERRRYVRCTLCRLLDRRRP